jgi:hypothetical protein
LRESNLVFYSPNFLLALDKFVVCYSIYLAEFDKYNLYASTSDVFKFSKNYFNSSKASNKGSYLPASNFSFNSAKLMIAFPKSEFYLI